MTIIYTPWFNLRKDASMATGQVSFHDQKMVRKIHVAVRQNPIVNRLNKTKVEKFPDLREEKEARLRELRKRDQGARDARVSDTHPLYRFEDSTWDSRFQSQRVLPFGVYHSALLLSEAALSAVSFTDEMTAERRSTCCKGAQGACMAERPCLRRHFL